MPALTRPMKITFGEMRASGIRDLLIYCSDYRCSHSIQMSADRWPDHVRLSDIDWPPSQTGLHKSPDDLIDLWPGASEAQAIRPQLNKNACPPSLR